MQAFLVILFMVVVGAVIGGVTNVIAIRMLFHPFKPYYIFKMRIPFTPGLIPKRREEIATKIGQVIEEHLITESVIHQKLNEQNTREAINDLVIKQLSKLKSDDATIRKFANQFDFDLDDLINNKLDKTIINKLNNYYYDKQATSINEILPAEVITMVDEKLDQAGDLIRERARNYLSSDKGARDIYDMLDTFFAEKGKIVGLLQMFMTKESIAERVQHELIRLTRHPKAKVIIDKVIRGEYETLKSQPLSNVVKEEQFTNISESLVHLIMTNLQLNEKMDTPISKLTPKLVDQIQVGVANAITDLIIKQASNHLSTIMTKINLRQMVENQINTFDLDYIERLIIEIANKELKLIMSLGFILGGIIGFFQGIVAIFV
ncbi:MULTISPECIES: DUF445 domain-containing protein [Staphylococcus]|uniref:DUF445 domain-containing protein n=1 Tax=Staphylococcus TaxID=1279 RepID=UPI0008A4B415|nr:MULTISPECIES: DUF445 family protein [Staphylococcus]MCH4392782.1 DUF445 family protein [Staphylococcus haemolyticus]MCI2951221.1 DUF445 family protein [Staphylococcus haemolyticus]OFP28315.1 hypothetical protein HMPREF2994_09955 [Staphylococcus sp. HMSC068H08]OFS53989.1 hypothetical protein HMPREF2862_09825 [Staphylococcus sp. HMSC065C09]OHP66392.1 hypothetical protein HMPREF2715_11065 [Staphylococcus sp. HMSC062A01]